ncbi:hypothetical protein [Vallitalea guaymasensis]|uniref:hypothetical protein n=1 Tax=Vallitalea guaymasensis TaxID=1185412 RepID=UPI000DE45A34|nr:hypothetical protein [Vallitalea guaymasensis]
MKKKWFLIITLFYCLTIAGVLFFYENIRLDDELEKRENNVRKEIDLQYMEKVLVATIKPDYKVGKYTAFTKEFVEEAIVMNEVPKKWVVDNYVFDKALLVGKVAKEDFRSQEQISFDDLSDEKVWFGDYDRIKEYSFATNVAGQAKKGTIIDVTVTYGNGDYDVVIPKTKVLDIIDNTDENGNLLPDKELRYEIILSIENEIDYRDMELAALLGTFKPRMYHDESQPASEKTFDYEKMLQVKKLQDKIVSDKNTDSLLEDQKVEVEVDLNE